MTTDSYKGTTIVMTTDNYQSTTIVMTYKYQVPLLSWQRTTTKVPQHCQGHDNW